MFLQSDCRHSCLMHVFTKRYVDLCENKPQKEIRTCTFSHERTMTQCSWHTTLFGSAYGKRKKVNMETGQLIHPPSLQPCQQLHSCQLWRKWWIIIIIILWIYYLKAYCAPSATQIRKWKLACYMCVVVRAPPEYLAQAGLIVFFKFFFLYVNS